MKSVVDAVYIFLIASLLAGVCPATAGLVTGLGKGGGGWIEVRDSNLANPKWRKVGWAEYNAANGETRPVACDLDGNGSDEIVIGFGKGGGGWLQVLSGGGSHLAWIHVNWSEYNSVNGETFPACGDIDGDGKAEIVAGLGRGGEGWLQVFDDTGANFAPMRWLHLDWSGYNQSSGETHPAVGDLDGDGRAEIVLGLGQGGEGWLKILDDATSNFRPMPNTPVAGGWLHMDWSAYNQANGTAWPAVCPGEPVLYVGLGKGGQGWIYFWIPGVGNDWHYIDWSSYNTAVGEYRLSCGLGPQRAVGLATFDSNGGWVLVDGEWVQVDWRHYNQSGGETWPAPANLVPDEVGRIWVRVRHVGNAVYRLSSNNLAGKFTCFGTPTDRMLLIDANGAKWRIEPYGCLTIGGSYSPCALEYSQWKIDEVSRTAPTQNRYICDTDTGTSCVQEWYALDIPVGFQPVQHIAGCGPRLPFNLP